MPLVSQILQDAITDPEFLYLPRKLLTYKPTVNKGDVVFDDWKPAPHLSLMDHVISDGKLDVMNAAGMCFRRIVWGNG
jgi:hypothetical protein